MIAKLTSLFSLKRETPWYSHLPEPIQNEVKAAMEATSRYDIP